MLKINILLTIIILIPVFLLSETLEVDDDYINPQPPFYNNVQNAVNACNNGDEILIHEGTYPENIVINRDDISMTLRSEIVNGEYLTETTILQGDANGGDIITIDRNFVSIAEITIAGLTISHAEGISGRGVNIFSGDCVNLGTIVFNYCIITGNTIDDGDGGGIYVKNESAEFNQTGGIELHNCIIANNEALNGGGVSINETKDNIEITDCSFSGNGAIYDVSSELGGTGGGVRIRNLFANPPNNDNALSIQNCSFVSNTCELNGGGLSIANIYPETEIYNCLFEDNLSVFAGGMYIANTGQANNPDWMTIDECSFLNNMAETIGQEPEWGNCGGGITADLSCYCILNSEFNENQTRGSGGAIAAQSSELLIRNSDITSNFAGGSGGGIVFVSKSGNDGCRVEMDNVILTGNIAGYRSYFASGVGGGIGIALYSYIRQFNGNNLTVSENQSLGPGSDGGGIFLHGQPGVDDSVEISDSCINNNYSEHQCGGLHLSGLLLAEVENVEICDNSVQSINNSDCNGIGLHLWGIEDCRVKDCCINDNELLIENHINRPEHADGGGIFVSLSSLEIDNCTIKNNSSFRGSGIHFGSADALSSAIIRNTVISNNTRHLDSVFQTGAIFVLVSRQA
ncbi:MAG: hypothetical protein K9M99_07810 [Candidatus Cloacimonetes bacterium]|nr:hypothetical protein [Candidatus Cloacimonadota bacterium]